MEPIYFMEENKKNSTRPSESATTNTLENSEQTQDGCSEGDDSQTQD